MERAELTVKVSEKEYRAICMYTTGQYMIVDDEDSVIFEKKYGQVPEHKL